MPALLIVLLVVLSAPTSIAARTWTVPTDAPTIKAGLDSSVAGDTVSVSCGTYFEYNIPMKPNVVLRSSTGNPTCVTIRPTPLHLAIVCNGGTPATVIEGLTISGADHEFGVGGGMVVSGSPTIRNCVFSGNRSPVGGGIYASGGPLNLIGCSFGGNWSIDPAGGYGGALRVGAAIIRNCSFSGNRAYWSGGAIYGDSLVISGCSFSSNIVKLNGGAIECKSATIESSTFINNKVAGNPTHVLSRGRGGAICFSDGVDLIRACQFVGNSTGGDDSFPTDGGTIYSTNGNLVLDHCAIIRSVTLFAYHASRGGALAVLGGTVKMTSCTISGGNAVLGGGIYLSDGAAATIDKTIISFARQGSAVYCDPGNAKASLSCSDLFGNAGGDWVGCIAGQAYPLGEGMETLGGNGVNGNFSADPLYCDTAAVDYRLTLASPCLSSGACGTIGAYESCVPTVFAPTGIESRSAMILCVSPNPSRGTISCAYRAALPGTASLDVFDTAGRLLHRENLEDAAGHVLWDGTDSHGRPAPSGVYFLRIAVGGHEDVRRVTLIR